MSTEANSEVAFAVLADAYEIAEMIEEAAENISHLNNLPPAANISANRIATLARAIRDAAMTAAQNGNHREVEA